MTYAGIIPWEGIIIMEKVSKEAAAHLITRVIDKSRHAELLAQVEAASILETEDYEGTYGMDDDFIGVFADGWWLADVWN